MRSIGEAPPSTLFRGDDVSDLPLSGVDQPREQFLGEHDLAIVDATDILKTFFEPFCAPRGAV